MTIAGALANLFLSFFLSGLCIVCRPAALNTSLLPPPLVINIHNIHNLQFSLRIELRWLLLLIHQQANILHYANIRKQTNLQ